MKRNKALAYILWLALPLTNLAAQTDSLRVLSVQEFVAALAKYHPVAKQASLLTEQAKAELMIARGGWDPILYSDYNSKTYDGNNYYSYFENKVSVPLWYGVEVKGGYDVVYGNKVNNESVLPQDGLGYVGISVSLLKNMLIDKRRVALQQAKIFTAASEQQRLAILNDLLLEGITSYYDWSQSYREWRIYVDALNLAKVRFEATVKSSNLGDRAAIDTTEALTQYQQRQIQVLEARQRFISATYTLHNYLWLENNEPKPVDTTFIPAQLSSQFTSYQLELSQLENLSTYQINSHPILYTYRLKLKQLDVERKLKIENLKPTLNASYNILSERMNFRSNAGLVLANNYKFGVQFNMPLSFTQARGDLKLLRLKTLDTQYLLDLKQRELSNKLNAYFTELMTLQQQTKVYENSIEGFRRLYDGEQTRFTGGESSLFLVNARENKYLESLVKLSEYQAKYYVTEAKLKWAAGNF